MKTIVTVWYLLKSLDGVEVVEGPTPELMEINHHICTQPWRIKRMAEIAFEGQFENAIIHDIDMGDTSVNPDPAESDIDPSFHCHNLGIMDCGACNDCAPKCTRIPILSDEKCKWPGTVCFECPGGVEYSKNCNVGEIIGWKEA